MAAALNPKPCQMLRFVSKPYDPLLSQSLLTRSRISIGKSFPSTSISVFAKKIPYDYRVSDDFNVRAYPKGNFRCLKVRASNTDSGSPKSKPNIVVRVLFGFLKFILNATVYVIVYFFTDPQFRFFGSLLIWYLDKKYPVFKEYLTLFIRFRTIYLGSGDLKKSLMKAWCDFKSLFPSQNVVDVDYELFENELRQSSVLSELGYGSGVDMAGDGNTVNEVDYIQLCDWIKKSLGDKVSVVRVSKDLGYFPCVILCFKVELSPDKQRSLKGRLIVLKVNPADPIVSYLNAACKKVPDSPVAKRIVDLLYDSALISGGFMPDNPPEFGWKIYAMMVFALGRKWGSSNT